MTLLIHKCLTGPAIAANFLLWEVNIMAADVLAHCIASYFKSQNELLTMIGQILCGFFMKKIPLSVSFQCLGVIVNINIYIHISKIIRISGIYKPFIYLANNMPADALVTLGAMQCISWQGIGTQKLNYYKTFRPRQDGPHFPDDTFNPIFMKQMLEFRLNFHWSLFLRDQLTIFHHWFR